MGLHQALEEVGIPHRITGVDIAPQKHYPFNFVLGNALEYELGDYDFIWASPPCQHITRATSQWRKAGRVYPDLIAPIRERLQATGVPYVIENVIGAPLINPVKLVGSLFNMRVKRDRLFECSWPVKQPFIINVQQDVTELRRPFDARKGQSYYPVGNFSGVAVAREDMGIPWMNVKEISQAIPPAYSRWIMQQWLIFSGLKYEMEASHEPA